jgi:hypothetical protein
VGVAELATSTSDLPSGVVDSGTRTARVPSDAARTARRLPRLLRRPRPPVDASDRAWLRAYVGLTFAGSAAVLALSPTTLMYWQALCLFHAAVLPLTLWGGLLLRTRHAARVLAGAATWAALAVLLALGIAFGTPDFRCRGLETVVFPLLGDSPMLHELHIQDTCPWPTGDPHGWWPDVLPRPAAAGQPPR